MKKKKGEIIYKGYPKFNNIREVINHSIEKYPDHKAFIVKHKKGNKVTYENITYKMFGEDINSLGTALIEIGLKNKRIAVIGKNSYKWVTTYVAVINGAGIIVPLDTNLPEQEIESLLQRSKADVVIFGEEHKETMEKIYNNKKTSVKHFICMENSENSIFKSYNEIIEKGKVALKEGNKQYINSKIESEKMATIIFTSGTTAKSKGVMLSHKNITSNIYDLKGMVDFNDKDVNLAFLPLHHTFGSTATLLFLASGSCNVFCDGLRHIQENLKEYKVTTFVGVPLLIETMYKKIMAQVEKQGKTKTLEIGAKVSGALRKVGIDIRRKLFKEIIDNLGGYIRIIISGASGIDKKVAKAFNDFGILTLQGYGLTETSPVIAAENFKTIKYGSVGVNMASVELKIHEPNQEGIGEIIAKGPNIMLGYYENEEATKEVIKDGWFYTGDLGYFDEEGYLFITGRKKNVIVLKNGKNVYPEELEQLINNLPYVSESMVYGAKKGEDLQVAAKIVYNKEYTDEKYKGKTEKELHEIIWQDIKEINKTQVIYKAIKKLTITDKPMIKTTTAKVKRHEEIRKMK